MNRTRTLRLTSDRLAELGAEELAVVAAAAAPDDLSSLGCSDLCPITYDICVTRPCPTEHGRCAN